MSDTPKINWMRYAGWGTQFIVSLLIAFYIGDKVDHYMRWVNCMNWIIPTIFIFFTLFKIIKDTQIK